MARKSKTAKWSKSLKDPTLLQFNMTDLKIDVKIEEDVSKEFKTRFINDAKAISQNIFIDKSYVITADNQHSDAFIREEGWTEFCKLLVKDHDKTINDDENNELIAQCLVAAEYYIRMCLKQIGYEFENYEIVMNEGSTFNLRVEVTPANYWTEYPGRWQEWSDETWKTLG